MSPGGSRSLQSMSTGSSARAPSSGIVAQTLRANTTGWFRDAVVGRGHDLCVVTMLEDAADGARVELRPVGEHDHRMGDARVERAESAAQ